MPKEVDGHRTTGAAMVPLLWERNEVLQQASEKRDENGCLSTDDAPRTVEEAC